MVHPRVVLCLLAATVSCRHEFPSIDSSGADHLLPSDRGREMRGDLRPGGDARPDGPKGDKPKVDKAPSDRRGDTLCTPSCAGKCKGAADGCGGNCPANSCSGCCDAAKACQLGTSDNACGTMGNPCAKCTSPDFCLGGYCGCAADCHEKCAGAPDGCGGTCPTSCSGCCNGTACLIGTSQHACGISGVTCVDCATGSCTGGACTVCTPSCTGKCQWAPDGCGGNCTGQPACSGCCNNQYLCVGGTSDNACGAGGLACVSCGLSESCINQQCQ